MIAFRPFGLLVQGSLLLAPAAPPDEEVKYGFATANYSIEMKVAFLARVPGRPLVFFNSLNPGKVVCYSGDAMPESRCADRFVGAAAFVTYTVTTPDGKRAVDIAIRERVTVLAQSPQLAPRPPFSRTQPLADGVASDLQVFGYDEGGAKGAERVRNRVLMKQAMWRHYRQELYIGEEVRPFAVVEWKHTLDRIAITSIYGPPPERE